jgi:hypothetical protein
MLLLPLRFAVYSSGGNLSRRSSCWQWGDTCAFPFRTATSRSCSPSGACAPITSPSGGGSSVTPQKFSADCDRGSDRPTTVGGWMRPTSGLRASGCFYIGLSTPPVRRSTSFCRLNATQLRLSAFSPKPCTERTIRRRAQSTPTNTPVIHQPSCGSKPRRLWRRIAGIDRCST